MSLISTIRTSHSITRQLLEWAEAAQRAFAPATQRAYQSDFDAFRAWCWLAGADYLPAKPEAPARLSTS